MTARRSRLGAAPAAPEDGVVAVEFALVVPLLLMVFFGIITFGITYNDQLSITNAAREGARLGAALDYNAAPATWASTVQTRVQQTYMNSLGASSYTTAKICVQLVDTTGTVLANASGTASAMGADCTSATPPTVPSNMTAGSCVVRVWTVKSARLSWLLVPDSVFNINASSVAYYGLKTGSCTAN